jgi:hypothetical protein
LRSGRRSIVSRIHAAILGGALCLSSATVYADDADDFLIARDNFTAGEFAQAAVQLRRLVGVEPVAVRAELVEPARKYYAAALFSMGQRAQAEQVIEAILRDNPDAALSPTLFSPPLQTLFYDTRQRMLPILNAIRDQRREEQTARQARLIAQRNLLRELATRETVVVRHSPWMALAPMGIPQFVAGQYGAGAAFLATEVALVGIAIGAVGLCHALVRDPGFIEPANAGRTCIEPNSRNPSWSVMAALQVVQVSAWSALGAVVIGGAIHSLLAIPAERREVRPRTAPAGWDRIQIAVSPTLGAPGLQLGGRF